MGANAEAQASMERRAKIVFIILGYYIVIK
jgi:hypothetical protein